MFRSLAACVSLCTLVAISQAMIRLDFVPDASYVAAGIGNPAAGKLLYSNNAGDQRGCVLINDQYVLTAGHNMPGGTTTVTVLIDGQLYNATTWTRHTLYNSGNLVNGYDFSVAKLDARVRHVAPLPMMASTTAAIGLTGTLVGHGASGTGITGQVSGPIVRRGGTNVIEQLAGYPNIFLTDFDNGAAVNNTMPGSSATPTALEFNVGDGDSGSPLLVTIGNEVQIAGITSFRARLDGGTNSSIYGSLSGFGRVGTIKTWAETNAHFAGRQAGKIFLNDYLGNMMSKQVTIGIRNPGSTTDLETFNVDLAIDGGYSFTTTRTGLFDLHFSIPGALQRTLTNVVLTALSPGNQTVILVNGDITLDNHVDLSDYLALVAAFDSALDTDPNTAGNQSSANWNANADVNGDGAVDLGDYLIVVMSFDLDGDQ